MTSLATADLAHTLIALAAILLCAHGMGSLFVRFRQPRAIGEILGGLLLGATVLGWIWPSAQAWMFPTDGSTSIILGAVYQLGLLLLLFMAGSELRTVFHRGERRTVAAVFAAGMCIPFVAGLGISQVIDQQSLWGPNGNTTSFLLVFSIAMAITSIPVISRIMHDLGILDTDFARVVLGVAVLEDLVLYVVLAIAIGYAGGTGGTLFGLPSALNISGGSSADMIYHVADDTGVPGGVPDRRPARLSLDRKPRDERDPARDPDRPPAHLHDPRHRRRTDAGPGGLLRRLRGRDRGRRHRGQAVPGDARDPQLLARLLHPGVLRRDRARTRPDPRVRRRLLRLVPGGRVRASRPPASTWVPAPRARTTSAR